MSPRALTLSQQKYEEANPGKVWPPADEEVEKAGGKLVKDQDGGLTGMFMFRHIRQEYVVPCHLIRYLLGFGDVTRSNSAIHPRTG